METYRSVCEMTASPETFRATRNPAFEERASRTRELFLLAQSCASEHERHQLLARVIEMHLDYAHAQAAKYRSRGVPLDDLRQVAALALTKAAHGYDVSTGHDFLSYAGPTIRGELRKYFRDHGWMIRPTRSIQELQARISTAEAELSYELGVSPRPAQIAEHLNVPIEPVLEALASDGCFTPASLDLTVRNDRAATLGDLLPGDDADHRAAEARMMLNPAIKTLSERDRTILRLRFFEGLTQREVADKIGVTQMQVSRLLTRILAQLRHRVGDVPT
jgi:RNA polymerase sigma-B factor